MEHSCSIPKLCRSHVPVAYGRNEDNKDDYDNDYDYDIMANTRSSSVAMPRCRVEGICRWAISVT